MTQSQMMFFDDIFPQMNKHNKFMHPHPHFRKIESAATYVLGNVFSPDSEGKYLGLHIYNTYWDKF